jgi:hypothetical protein
MGEKLGEQRRVAGHVHPEMSLKGVLMSKIGSNHDKKT